MCKAGILSLLGLVFPVVIHTGVTRGHPEAAKLLCSKHPLHMHVCIQFEVKNKHK